MRLLAVRSHWPCAGEFKHVLAFHALRLVLRTQSRFDPAAVMADRHFQSHPQRSQLDKARTVWIAYSSVIQNVCHEARP
jgi:hypothetical protein